MLICRLIIKAKFDKYKNEMLNKRNNDEKFYLVQMGYNSKRH